ncbi:TerC/Alx family metal homeostasis membrane protein [Dermacoccus nishinomiyaensis]|uniref:TerC/Alx family metal homeostasis membrane protein n=1 Tax=Dermacoccus nishinomiyaensis TaxID=1274 RepID=UPI0028AAFC2B|nr:TerC/Alx family metal homeostasis membrane protein [Dermacoccus nishinomiyaensis]
MHSLATPTLWAVTLIGLIVLFALDFLVTRKPHEVSLKEATAWSTFYIALPVAFGAWLWSAHGSTTGTEFYTGYLVEKSLSVDNLFLFMMLLTAFAVPKVYQQRVLLIGVAGALVMRAIMIALGAQLLTNFAWMFVIFGAFLLWTAVKVWRDTRQGDDHTVDPGDMRIVKVIRRFFPVTDGYRGSAMLVREDADAGATGRSVRRALTPLAVVTLAVLATDALFALDSVPAVYGITSDPYLVFVTNAFALLGLRALYFLVEGVLGKLVHLGYGLAVILAFIGYKLIAHWAHDVWSWVWTPSTAVSLSVIVLSLLTVTATSLVATRRR